MSAMQYSRIFFFFPLFTFSETFSITISSPVPWYSHRPFSGSSMISGPSPRPGLTAPKNIHRAIRATAIRLYVFTIFRFLSKNAGASSKELRPFPLPYSTSVKASFPRPQMGHTQSSGISSKAMPGAMPLSGSPASMMRGISPHKLIYSIGFRSSCQAFRTCFTAPSALTMIGHLLLSEASVKREKTTGIPSCVDSPYPGLNRIGIHIHDIHCIRLRDAQPM